MNRHFLLALIIATGALASCGQPPQESNSSEVSVDTMPGFQIVPEMDWREHPNADVITGDVRWRHDVTQFEFGGESASQIEEAGERLLLVHGAEGQVVKENAKKWDLIWTSERAYTIWNVYPAPGDAVYVEATEMVFFDYVWGDVEIDIGEVMTRSRMAQLGLYTHEKGYLAEPADVEQMGQDELIELYSRLAVENDHLDFDAETLEVRRAGLASADLPAVPVNLNMEVLGGRIVFSLTGSIVGTVEFDAILRFRAFKEDAVLWFDADFDYDSRARSRDYPRCYSRPYTGRTCVDHVYVRFTPGLELQNFDANVTVNTNPNNNEGNPDGGFDFTCKDQLNTQPCDPNSRKTKWPLGRIPIGPLTLNPNFVVGRILEGGASGSVTVGVRFNADYEIPLGIERFGDRNFARAECGGIPDGCTVGINTLPNSARPEHEIRKDFDIDPYFTVKSGEVGAKLGVAPALGLDVGAAGGVVTLEGIRAGVKLLGEISWQPLQVSSMSSSDCFKSELKVVPFISLDLKVMWDLGRRGELIKFKAFEATLQPWVIASESSNDACVMLTPRDGISVRVTNANDPQGVADDSAGYEIDQIYATRTDSNGNTITIPVNGALDGAGGRCDGNGGWNGEVEHLTGSNYYNFDQGLQPGDIVHVVRVEDDFGGACLPSGTADFYLEGGPYGDFKLGTADNSKNDWTFPVTASAFE